MKLLSLDALVSGSEYFCAYLQLCSHSCRKHTEDVNYFLKDQFNH